MRMHQALATIFFAVTVAAVTVTACSKDDDDDETTPLTAEQKAQGNQAAGIAAGQVLSSAGDSAGLRDGETRAHLRALVADAKAQRRAFLTATQDAGDYDLCALLAASCTQDLGKEPVAEADGTKCSTTACEGGTTMSCTSPATTSTCKDVTYTFSESNVSTVSACTKGAADTYTLDIKADFAGAISGGAITTPMTLACKINFSMPFGITDDTTASEEDTELSCESGAFTCSLNGEELSCAEMKAAMAENACE